MDLAQHNAVHMCIDSTSPKFENFPALIPPRRVTFVEIGLWVHSSSSLLNFDLTVKMSKESERYVLNSVRISHKSSVY